MKSRKTKIPWNISPVSAPISLSRRQERGEHRARPDFAVGRGCNQHNGHRPRSFGVSTNGIGWVSWMDDVHGELSVLNGELMVFNGDLMVFNDDSMDHQ